MMGDPTEPSKGSNDDQEMQSDNDMQSDDSDIDAEAEQIQPAAVGTNIQHSTSSPTVRSQQQRNGNNGYAQSDTIQSILSSISNPNAAVIMPFGDDLPMGQAGDEEIDADRMERFYSSSLSAITKMRRQTMKVEAKTEKLRDELGHANMQAWTEEHCDSLKNLPPPK